MNYLKQNIDSYREKIKVFLVNHQFNEVILLLDNICRPEILKASKYDYYSNVTPYDRSVSEFYNIDYINSSFVTICNDEFIACQDPKHEYLDRFLNFLSIVDFQCILALNPDSKYPHRLKVESTTTICFENEPFIDDVVYSLNSKTIRRICCKGWDDFSTLSVEKMNFLCDYFEKFDQKLKIIHCKAGVGRTGTFIMYRTLRKNKVSTIDEFVDIFLELRLQRHHLVTTKGQLQFLYETFVILN